MTLSKSDYITFLKHPAWLWLKKHAPERLPEEDANANAVMAEGRRFEVYAERLFPGAVRLGFETMDGAFDSERFADLLELTRTALMDPRTPVLQGRVQVNGLSCIFDALVPTERDVQSESGAFDLIEIKASTSVKTEHLHDLAFQTIVLADAGYVIDRIGVLHVNNAYERTGEIDPAQLSKHTDVTDVVRAIIPETRARIFDARAVIALPEMLDPSPRHVGLGAFSEWLKVFDVLVGGFSEDSIYRLTGIGANRAGALEDLGVSHIADIPDGFDLTPKQERQVQATKTGERHIDRERIAYFLGGLQYPLYFLDYESFASVIPPFDRLHPYQQVPFQYSLHILEAPDAPLVHREYLHTDNTLPIGALCEQLAQDIGPVGSVVVWHASYEKGRNTEMAKLALDHADVLHHINERVVDLMIPFSSGWFVDENFHGSASIKAVLPVMVPELSYKALTVRDGNTAQRVWMEVVQQGGHAQMDTEMRETIFADLRNYCELDTLAMVRIYEELMRCVEGEVGR